MLNWLTEQVVMDLMINHIDPRTPAGYEKTKQILGRVLGQKHQQEPMVPEWTFPLVVKIDGVSPTPKLQLDIQKDWEAENILYLDFDNPSLFPSRD